MNFQKLAKHLSSTSPMDGVLPERASIKVRGLLGLRWWFVCKLVGRRSCILNAHIAVAQLPKNNPVIMHDMNEACLCNNSFEFLHIEDNDEQVLGLSITDRWPFMTR